MANTVVLLTYDHPHRKTQDVLVRLRALGTSVDMVLGLPWVQRNSWVPDIPHRPDPLDVPMAVFCNRMGFSYHRVVTVGLKRWLDDLQPDLVVIGGANILSAEVVENYRVINAHPGWLPYIRGLDALKWAIHEGSTIGVTVYRAAAAADTGLLLRREPLELTKWDTFHSVARRLFDLEVFLTAWAVELTEADFEDRRLWFDDSYALRRRMPHALEASLYDDLRTVIDARFHQSERTVQGRGGG